MRRSQRLLGIPLGIALAGALLAALACTTDSPSEPGVPPPAPPVPPAPAVSFQVTASPSVLVAGSDDASTITVSAFQGSTPLIGNVTITTSLGGFGSVGGPNSVVLPLSNGQATVSLFAGTVPGIATIQASLPVGAQTASATATVEIRQADTFFLASVSPGNGDPDGGDEVSIEGGGFDEPVRVLFGSAPAQVLSVSGSRIRVRTPSAIAATGSAVPVGESRTVPVSVTINLNEANQASDTLANAFTFARGNTNVVQITSVTPNTGGNDGGTRVSINGSGFVAPLQVLFELGSVAVEATIEDIGFNRIVVISPAARGFAQAFVNQAVTIRVRLLGTGQEAFLPQAFRYGADVIITRLAPNEGPHTGGQLVTIEGQGFDEPLAVEMGGKAQQVISVTGTQIVVRTVAVAIEDCDEPSGPVRVVNSETGDEGVGPVYAYRVPKPVIVSISPSSGPEGGNTLVTITGPPPSLTVGFDPPTRVTFDESLAAIVSESATQIQVRSPLFTGTFPTRGCTIGGQPGTQFVPVSVDVTVENLSTGCEGTVTNGFTYLPADGSCRPTPVPPPTANFTFSSSGLTVIFQDTSSGAPTSWSWDFGDTNTSAQQNPTHTYAVGGTYVVTLTVSNAGGSSTISQFVTVP